jgi:hypothetical protein
VGSLWETRTTDVHDSDLTFLHLQVPATDLSGLGTIPHASKECLINVEANLTDLGFLVLAHWRRPGDLMTSSGLPGFLHIVARKDA